MKNLFCLLLFVLCSIATSIQAKETCPNLFTYDVTINPQIMSITNDKARITITENGQISLNEKQLVLNPEQQKRVIHYQNKVKNTFTTIEKTAKWHLANLNTQFTGSINRQLGANNTLLPYLDGLYQNLLALLRESVETKNNQTQFHYKKFATFTEDGQDIAQKSLFGILGNSLKNFSLIKNYKALRNLAKKEWREQKDALKTFQHETCLTLNSLESEQQQLLKSVTAPASNAWFPAK